MVTPEGARKLADAFDEAGKFGPANVLRDLANQVEALQADAERYAFLKSMFEEKQNGWWIYAGWIDGAPSIETFDDAIDEAMKNDKDIRTETPT